ncbi:MAG: PIN domain-containing protein [Deltaproteobacteria bacterium]|nr:PIN domain-containing protein [Deltaproteobacteria bacterium]
MSADEKSRSVLIDSSAVLALLDRSDGAHGRAVKTARLLAEERVVLLQTTYLRVETHGLLVGRLGHAVARAWLLARPFPALAVAPDVEARAWQIVATHVDKAYSLCDALTFAFMEVHRIRRAFALDRHFRQYGRFQVMP